MLGLLLVSLRGDLPRGSDGGGASLGSGGCPFGGVSPLEPIGINSLGGTGRIPRPRPLGILQFSNALGGPARLPVVIFT
ncbi:unnamed protein product [Lasius platythorax]|uniref:Secreted protein n=1 Tax=Lasius platythorax TaxID=488582 RepID=A0AAV2MZM9_9HYME